VAFKNYDSSGNVLSRSLTDLPVGTIVSTALSAAPYGWLICDGAAVSRTNYPELFGALGTGYGAGNGTTTFNVPNSDGQMILAISTAQRIGVAMPPQFVTTLPSSPIDGTEVYYQSTIAGTGGGATNTMADVGAVWHLRYRSAASGSYKWEMVGGSALDVTLTSTPTAITATTPTSLSTNPILTLPNAGTYRLEVFSNTADVGVGAGRLAIDFSVGMTETASVASGAEIYTSAAELISPMFGSFVKDITGAGTLLTMKAWASTGATFYPQVRTSVPYGIRATPIRVSA
jgi:microcystin-dependent protein